MDSNELSRMLSERAQDVCAYLLPNGKIKGNDYFIGGLDGSAGESLKITMTGPRSGMFVDFANNQDKGGSLLWLWKLVRGVKFTEAISEAKEWLGIKEEEFGIHRHNQKTYSKPANGGLRLSEPNTKVMDYLTIERRLDPITVAKARVCESDDGEWIILPYYELENGKWQAVHRKMIKLDRVNGKKECSATKGTKRCLYGKNLIDDDVTQIVICEGEIDSLSWNSWGIPAVSIPNGVADFEWVDIDWEWLGRFERIYVSCDMDDPGKICAEEICKRLGLHRCFIVTLPKKDANECLVEGLKAVDMVKCLDSAKQIELDEIKRPGEYESEVLDYYTTDWSQRGWSTPWYPTLPWRVRRAELTILSGFSGSGKTAALNNLMLDLVKQGVRIMDASLEIKPGLTLYNMTRCAMARKNSSKQEIADCIKWLNESMFFLDCIGTVSSKRLIHAMEYARKRHGIDVFVIDSLFKCGLNSEDWGAQREFADQLTTFCNNTGAHVILVAHSRKMSNGNELSIPSKADIAGSSDLSNAAFNVIIWWRNKLKKRKLDELRSATLVNQQEVDEWEQAPDGRVVIDKQRFGEGEEAEVAVWFDKASTQFATTKGKIVQYFR